MNKPFPFPGPAAAAVVDDWWRGAVIYQIYPRSFQDTNGDGIGDLAGITARLPYVADLGVDAIWISPFFTSPMKDFGYDVANYEDVDPIFGTLDDFRALMAEAKRLGLKVLIDLVLSHTSDRHPWFVESRRDRTNPKADWYVWADARPDGTPPTNWLSVFGGSAWEWDTGRCQYYLHNFLAAQPDLNFHNPKVQDAILDVARFWLALGVDGFRLDAVNFAFHDADLRDNPPRLDFGAVTADTPAVNPYGRQIHLYDKTRPENIDFLRRFRALLDRHPGTTTIGEVGDNENSLKTIAAYTSGNDKLHMCYSFQMLGDHFGADYFRAVVEETEAASDGWPCWALSNHDCRRTVSRFLSHASDPARQARVLAAMLLSLRGTVCLYQGEELGLPEADVAFEDLVDPYGIRFWPEFKGRDGCRTPMVWQAEAANGGFSTARPWLPVPAEHLALAVDCQIGRPDSVLESYRQFIAFRRRHPALVRGSITFLPAAGEVLAVLRRWTDETVLVVLNLGRVPATFRLPDGVSVSGLSGHGFTGRLVGETVEVGAEDAFFGRAIDGGDGSWHH